MSQAAFFVVVQLVAIVTCLKHASSDVQAITPLGSTMAYDGKDWFFKVPDEYNQLLKQSPEWHETSDCDIHPPGKGEFFSQSNEDMDLYNAFFCNKTGGTFVELGALDGVRFSNTKFFEDSLGWSGLLIEASPGSFAALQQNRPNPKNSILAEGVCPDGQGTMPFLVDGDPAVSGNPDTMSDSFQAQWHHGDQLQIDVPCRSLNTQLNEFLLRAGADHIDFFSLDVEGGELAVLQTFTFDVPVNSWVIEMDGHDPAKDEGVRQLLTERGYVRSHITYFSDRNEVWVMPQLDQTSQ